MKPKHWCEVVHTFLVNNLYRRLFGVWLDWDVSAWRHHAYLVSGLRRYMTRMGHCLEFRNPHGMICDHLHYNVTGTVFALASYAEDHFLRKMPFGRPQSPAESALHPADPPRIHHAPLIKRAGQGLFVYCLPHHVGFRRAPKVFRK